MKSSTWSARFVLFALGALAQSRAADPQCTEAADFQALFSAQLPLLTSVCSAYLGTRTWTVSVQGSPATVTTTLPTITQTVTTGQVFTATSISTVTYTTQVPQATVTVTALRKRDDAELNPHHLDAPQNLEVRDAAEPRSPTGLGKVCSCVLGGVPSLITTVFSTTTLTPSPVFVTIQPSTTVTVGQATTVESIITQTITIAGSTTTTTVSPGTGPTSSRVGGALAVASPSIASGNATYYSATINGGACGFPFTTLGNGVFPAAFPAAAWDNAAECGACLNVTAPDGNSIIAMVVDECATCPSTALGLPLNALSQLSPSSSTESTSIPITYQTVSCGSHNPLQIVTSKDTGYNEFAFMVWGANLPVAYAQASRDQGQTWVDLVRQTTNYWVYPGGGLGTGTVWVRMKSVVGSIVFLNNVVGVHGRVVLAPTNF